MISVVIFFAM